MFSARVSLFLQDYRIELVHAMTGHLGNDEMAEKINSLQEHLKDLQNAGQHEDQLVLYILDMLVTGIRYGNW